MGLRVNFVEGRSTSKCLGWLRCLACLALAQAPISCGNSDVDCEIDVVFTQPQKLDIQRAAADWNAFTVREVKFVDGGDWLIVSAQSPHGLGYAESKRRLIRISPQTPDGQIYAVALHELGHALGLRHVSKGVMDPDHQTIEFSPEDFAECKRAGACR